MAACLGSWHWRWSMSSVAVVKGEDGVDDKWLMGLQQEVDGSAVAES